MKRVFIFLMILAFASVSFAQTDKKTVKQKPDLATQKKIQFFKLMAGEEKKILDKYIKCLNTVDNEKGLMVCNNKRREMSAKLRKAASPMGKQQPKRPHMQQKPAKKK